MDRVFIESLTVETVIGIFDWGREIRQAVVTIENSHCGIATQIFGT